MSKLLNPKAWYLVGAGAVALAADGARRIIKRRRSGAGQSGAKMATTAPVVTATPTAEAQAKTTKAVETVAQETAAAKSASAAAAKRQAKATLAADDLTELKGIGPVFAQRLREAGITTFTDVAKATPDALREATQATGAADPEEWIAQAKGRM
jgi:large subunit ribosomal protein L21